SSPGNTSGGSTISSCGTIAAPCIDAMRSTRRAGESCIALRSRAMGAPPDQDRLLMPHPGRCQTSCLSPPTRSSNKKILLQCECPLLALSGHPEGSADLSAFGGKADIGRRIGSVISAAFDPKRTLAGPKSRSAAIIRYRMPKQRFRTIQVCPKDFAARQRDTVLRPSRVITFEPMGEKHGSSPGLFESKKRRALVLLRRGSAHGGLHARRRR